MTVKREDNQRGTKVEGKGERGDAGDESSSQEVATQSSHSRASSTVIAKLIKSSLTLGS